MNLKQSIGLRVKTARQARHFSQGHLSELIERSTETVSNIERGVTVPNVDTLERLSKVLDVPMFEFFEGCVNTSTDRKRLVIEMEIRECLRQLSVAELKVTKIQVQALVNLNEGNTAG